MIDRLIWEVDIVHANDHPRGSDHMNLTRDCPHELCRAATAARSEKEESA